MQPDYKNWVPKGMAYGLVAGTATLVVGTAALWSKSIIARTACGVGAIACGAFATWCFAARRVFSFENEDSLSRRIVDGTCPLPTAPSTP